MGYKIAPAPSKTHQRSRQRVSRDAELSFQKNNQRKSASIFLGDRVEFWRPLAGFLARERLEQVSLRFASPTRRGPPAFTIKDTV
jgi:hypothetical protein